MMLTHIVSSGDSVGHAARSRELCLGDSGERMR